MNLLVNTKYRSDQQEIMDDLNYDGPILYDSLNKLAQINKWLGGNKVTISGLKKLLEHHPKKEPITIVDLGCGGGDLLRQISGFGKRYRYRFQLIGIDANANTITYAKSLSKGYDNIEFKAIDIFSDEFKQLKYDVVLATLFFHHFNEDELISILTPVLKKADIGIVVNDLHRNKLAYYLFKILCTTIKNETIIRDGLTSILRGFKYQEIKQMSQQLGAHYDIKWKWAFRYQWLLKENQF